MWGGGEYSFSNMRVGAILGNGCGIQGQNYVTLSQESEMTTEFFTTGIKFYVYIGLG